MSRGQRTGTGAAMERSACDRRTDSPPGVTAGSGRASARGEQKAARSDGGRSQEPSAEGPFPEIRSRVGVKEREGMC